MTGEPPGFEPREEQPAEPPSIEPPPPAAAPPREPFWGYADLMVVAGLGIPGMAVVAGAAGFALSRLTPVKALQLLPAQFLGYAVLFAIVWFVFRTHYERPFWRSLGWVECREPAARLALYGMLTALAVVLAALAMGTPDAPNPMKELLATRTGLILTTAFGTTLGPLCEELIFRGFLQPLAVRSLGAIAGVFAAALPFGLLHLPQYGYSWRHALLVTLAGCAFGWVRHRTGSTRASTVMHAAYNGLFFLALLTQRKDVPQPW